MYHPFSSLRLCVLAVGKDVYDLLRFLYISFSFFIYIFLGGTAWQADGFDDELHLDGREGAAGGAVARLREAVGESWTGVDPSA